MLETGIKTLKSDARELVDWTADYAGDVWHHPGNHIGEIVTAGVAAVGLAIPQIRAGVRLAAEALASRAGAATLADTAEGMVPAADAVKTLSGRQIKDALGTLDRLAFKTNANADYASGIMQGDGTRVVKFPSPVWLTKPGVYKPTWAHELEFSPQGDGFTARYIVDGEHTAPRELPGEKALWPNNSFGPFENLTRAGVKRAVYNGSTMLTYDNSFNRLTISSATSGNRWNIILDDVLNGEGTQATENFTGIGNAVDRITVEGENAVTQGSGLIKLSNVQGAIRGVDDYGYPAVAPGEDLTIHFDADGTSWGMRPVPEQARVITFSKGLIPRPDSARELYVRGNELLHALARRE